MSIIQIILQNLFSFILIISLIVFIHEFGHFFVARLCGVKVEVFSIGFGYEIFGFNDKKQTRWKFCLIPFGGYVKMFGDQNAASMPNLELVEKMSQEEKKNSLIGKNVYQRFAIVFAGPLANFILTILILTILFRINGLNKVLPVIDQVIEKSPAAFSGLKSGDQILAINQIKINDFEEVRKFILQNEKEIIFLVQRGKKTFELKIKPELGFQKDIFGDQVKTRFIGITASQVEHDDLNLLQSFIIANQETYKISVSILKVLGELITNKRSIEELGGPIKIAKYSGESVKMGISFFLWFIAMISVNLAVMNLLPLPALDGGHLFFYLIEMIIRKPIPLKIQKIAFSIGFILLITMMIFVTVNDIKNLLN
jgi:regulator of sigma E protease